MKVDNTTPNYNLGFLAYFPNNVTVRPGDTLDFKGVFSGEPHSVTMGTLVEAGLAAAQAAGPNATTPPPAFASLPVMLPNGPGDADQRAVNPCFISTGSLPADAKTACPTVAQPAFDGTQKYYSSGFISKGSDFKMTLASTIKPGTYHYYCNLHGPDMSGTITVAPSGSSIPSQSDVDSAGQTQLNDLVSKITPAIQSAASGHPQVPPGIKVAPNLAGFASQDVSTVTIDQFFPATIHTTVGKTVSWTIVGAHTISFGEPSNPPYALKEAPDGTWHADEQAGSPVPPPPGPPPSGNSNAPITVDGGSYNGSGIASSGVQASFPPALVTYNLKFTKAGTYNYVCLIHPGMVGQVVVS